jgi:hypothetical protein
MIKKTNEGYIVLSDDGKPLSKPNLTLTEAKRRLQSVERFKKINKK